MPRLWIRIVCFAAFGYQRIKPPLVEFEQTLLADGPGARVTRPSTCWINFTPDDGTAF